MTLAERLKQQALALGFDAAGICGAAPSAHAPFFARWVEAGYAGEMVYLTRRVEQRGDPDALLPGCRSILVVGLNSYLPLQAAALGHGIVARYAPRDDYHDVMTGRLLVLRDWLAAQLRLPAAAVGRAAVDTAPLLERELAMRAGLGWIGKNCCLISPLYGSWLLLGELLLTMDLPPDDTWAISHCGTCTRCQQACPTGALVEPYLLDARRCIAYLTIENRGAIPEELRPLLGQHIFGCDLCQEACPWNGRRCQPGRDPVFQARLDLLNPPLLDLMALDDDGFRQRFAGTPMQRAKRRGLLRNVATALGNWGHPAAGAALTQALHDPELLVADAARRALSKTVGETPCSTS
jgi:epoxyqueuosine reductase